MRASGDLRQNGGSACGYQPGFALSALQETADVRVADSYIYTPALAGRLSAAAWSVYATLGVGRASGVPIVRVA
jgi:hypothetical protein